MMSLEWYAVAGSGVSEPFSTAELKGAPRLAGIELDTQAPELRCQHPHIEPSVVGYQDVAAQPFRDRRCDLTEGGCGCDHRGGQAVDARRTYVSLRVDERLELVNHLPASVESDQRDLDHAVGWP